MREMREVPHSWVVRVMPEGGGMIGRVISFYRDECPCDAILVRGWGESCDKRGLALYETDWGAWVWLPKTSVASHARSAVAPCSPVHTD